MTKFLKLNEVMGNSATQTLLLNPAYIASVKIAQRGVDTHICMSGNGAIKYYFVKESVDQIWDMLNNHNTYLMSDDEARAYFKAKSLI